MFRRGSRGSRRGSSPRAVVQSFKKVINIAPASIVASTNITASISTGVDSVAAGQTSAVDSNVPTGSVIRFIEIQWAAQNLVNVAAFAFLSIQRTHSGQGVINPQVVGGDPQRNQVHFQRILCIGQNQNVNFVMKFKVPKKYQRVRDGDTWKFTIQSTQIATVATQIIYKFYR